MNTREALEKAHKTYPLHNYTYPGDALDILAPKIEAALRKTANEMLYHKEMVAKDEKCGDECIDKCVTAGIAVLSDTDTC